MNKKSLLLFVFSISLLALNAKQRTEGEAINLVQQFEKSGAMKIKSHSTSTIVAPPTLAYVAECDNAEPAYYAFNYGNDNGFVIVSAEDKTFPILGYSDEGTFDYSNVPENMKWWLSKYVNQIEYVRNHPELSAAPQRVPSKSTSVAPILKNMMWNQGSPYNLLSPTYTSDGQTYQSVTGCVATAMAQIMYHHKWPERGTGSNTYKSVLNGDDTQYKMITVNFADSKYDWANMKPIYNSSSSDVSNNAVAKLMYDCGVSVNMQYGSTSLAITSQTICAFANYFGYDKSIDYVVRDAYTCSQWDEILCAEMDAQRPVLYSGRNNQGGHAFVLDGYDENGYYHVNWGWGGLSNGYFLFYDLTPNSQGLGGSSAGYNDEQGMVIGIKKDEGGTNKPHLMMDDMSLYYSDETEVSLDEQFYIKLIGLHLITTEIEGLSPYLGCGLYKEDGTLVTSSLAQIGTLINGYFYPAPVKAVIPSTVPEGKYQLKALYSFTAPSAVGMQSIPSENPADVQLIPIALYGDQYIQVDVRDGKAYFAAPEAVEYSLKETAMEVTSGKVYAQRNFKVKATVTNESADEYQDDLYIALLDGDGTVKSTSSSKAVYIPQGESVEIETVMEANLPAGNYTLKVLDTDEKVVSGEGIGVEVLDEPAAASLQITSQLAATKTNVDLIEAKATIKNQGGYFANNINLLVLEKDNNNILQLVPSGFVSFDNNEAKDVNFSFSIPGASVGDTYRILLCDPTITDYYQVWGNVITLTLDDATGIDRVSDVADMQIYPNPAKDVVTIVSPAEISRISIYTMLGACVREVKTNYERDARIDVSTLSAGQYIVRVENAEGVITKILVKK